MRRLIAFIKKPYYAWRGFSYIVRRESSFRFQLAASAAVLSAGAYLKITAGDWALVLMAISAVLVTEVFNTVVERLLDVLEPRFSSHVALLKDLLATAALIVGVAGVAVVLVVLFQYIS